jgi:hypothetical protein
MAADYLEILSGAPGGRPMAAQTARAPKRKQSKKQRAASLRNLAKARAKVGRGGSRLTPAEKARSTENRGKRMAKGKKQSKKQRARAIGVQVMKNLAKARKALRAKGHTGKKKTKSPRSASRSASKPKSAARKKPAAKKKGAMAKSRSSKPAKRAGMRKAPRVPKAVRPSASRAAPRRPAGSKQTPAQHRASLRNLAKARAARKRANKRHPVKPHSYPVRSKNVHVPAHKSWESRERRSKQTPAQRRASLANLRKARAAQKRGHRGGARETARASKGQTPAQRRASLRNLAKARAARKKATSRHNVGSDSYNRKAATRHIPGHLSWEHGFYENPLSGAELFFGGFSGLIWFMLTDFVDRVIATHDLTDKGTKDAAGHELYADSPPTSGDYAGIFNPTAICAPMNAWRWLAGLGMIVLPLGASAVISSEQHPNIKASAQGMFFGSTMRIGGKALIDLVAYVAMWNPFGQRLYDGEMRAQILASSDQTPLSSLPSAGLGSPGCECESCKAGVGACQAGTGTGWPSNVREAAPANDGGGQPPAPPAPPPTTTTHQPGASEPGYLAGAGIAALPARNPFSWGREEEKEKERAA